MPTKKEILDTLRLTEANKMFSLGEVKAIITSVTGERREVKAPDKLRVGDIIICRSSVKPRPAVITKVLSDGVYYIPLTSTNNEMAGTPYYDRFMGDGFFGKSVGFATISYAKDHWAGVFDNKTALNRAIRETIYNIYSKHNVKHK